MPEKKITLQPGETLTVEFTDRYDHLRERLVFRIAQAKELRARCVERGECQGVAVQDAKIKTLEDVVNELDKIQQPR